MKKYNLFQENVKEGNKITVVSQGEFGGVCVSQMTYLGSEPAAYYCGCPQEMYGVALLFKPKGRRRTYKMTLEYSALLIVYKGYVNINVGDIVYKRCGNAKISRYGMHDSLYFTDTLKAYPNFVLFSDIPNKEEER